MGVTTAVIGTMESSGCINTEDTFFYAMGIDCALGGTVIGGAAAGFLQEVVKIHRPNILTIHEARYDVGPWGRGS